MRPVLLAAALLLPLGGWSVWWWQAASEAKTQIRTSITHLNTQMKASGSFLQLEYKDLSAGHFFGAPHVIVENPALVAGGLQPQRIEVDWLRLAPGGETTGQWHVTLAPVLRATQQGRDAGEYTVIATPLPEVWVRSPSAQQAEAPASGPLGRLLPAAPPAPDGWPADAIHQWAYKLPNTLELTAVRSGKGNKAQFTLPSSPLRLWQPLPLRPDDRIDFFFALLAEIVEANV